MNMTGNTILITGGTSGIGRALAEAFHARQNQVIIAGRRQQLLDEITAANPGMVGLELDVEDENSINTFTVEVKQRFPKLNVLINNAGISKRESFTTDPVETGIALSIVQTNITSVLQLTAALLPLLKSQPHATLMATTSGLAFVPMAGYPTYCASKAFLHSWLQALRFQLRETSVEVLELAPPYVQTELGGKQQASDERAMPLDAFTSEVMQILTDHTIERGEILVDNVKAMRWAEKNGQHDQMVDMMGNF